MFTRCTQESPRTATGETHPAVMSTHLLRGVAEPPRAYVTRRLSSMLLLLGPVLGLVGLLLAQAVSLPDEVGALTGLVLFLGGLTIGNDLAWRLRRRGAPLPSHQPPDGPASRGAAGSVDDADDAGR